MDKGHCYIPLNILDPKKLRPRHWAKKNGKDLLTEEKVVQWISFLAGDGDSKWLFPAFESDQFS